MDGAMPVEASGEQDGPLVVSELGELPPSSIVDVAALAAFFWRCPTTIKRAAKRGGISRLGPLYADDGEMGYGGRGLCPSMRCACSGHRRKPRSFLGGQSGHQKCLLAKARPEWDFRYLSNATAFCRELKATAVSTRQGRCVAVCGTCPPLWAAMRAARSPVSPV